jgi:hypothetical protein
MLLDAELYDSAMLVRPVASTGKSARTMLHESWLDHVDGAPYPSFAPLTLAREATICAALAYIAAREGLRVVSLDLIISCDGTNGAKTRAGLTSLHTLCHADSRESL